jgi:hypothetical protein
MWAATDSTTWARVPPVEAPLVTGQVLEPLVDPATVDLRDRRHLPSTSDRSRELTQVVPEVRRPLPPLDGQRLDGVAAVLLRSGGVEGHLGPGRSTGRHRRSPHHVLVDRRRPLGEEATHPRLHTDHVAQTGRRDLPRGADAFGQLPAQAGVVDRAGRPQVSEDPPAVHRRPHTVDALGHVGHHQVAVEVRIEGPAGAVNEVAGHHAGRRHQGEMAIPGSPHPHGSALEIVGCFSHRGMVPVADLAGDLARSQEVQNAHRLGRAERQVETGHAAIPPDCP